MTERHGMDDDKFRLVCVIILGIVCVCSLLSMATLTAIGRDIPAALAAALGGSLTAIAALAPPHYHGRLP